MRWMREGGRNGGKGGCRVSFQETKKKDGKVGVAVKGDSMYILM